MTKLNTSDSKEQLEGKNTGSEKKSLKSKVAGWLKDAFSTPEKKAWGKEDFDNFFGGDFQEKLVSSCVHTDLKELGFTEIINFDYELFEQLISKDSISNEELDSFVKSSLSSDTPKIYQGKYMKVATTYNGLDGEGIFNENQYLNAICRLVSTCVGNLASSDIKREDHYVEARNLFDKNVAKNMEKNNGLSHDKNLLKSVIITLQKIKKGDFVM